MTTTTLYKCFSSKEMAMRSRTGISLSCPATPCGECASLEHTLTTALAVLLSLIHSRNWLQLPVCLVRACKLKEEASASHVQKRDEAYPLWCHLFHLLSRFEAQVIYLLLLALGSCPVKYGPAVRMSSGPLAGKLWILCSVG